MIEAWTIVNTTLNPIEFNGRLYDQRHGGPFDRGAADSYYGRPRYPHYYTGPSRLSQEVLVEEGTEAYDEYMAGYAWNEQFGEKKDWY